MLIKQKTGAILNERLAIKEGGTGRKRVKWVAERQSF